jgi:hypothetical protein
MAGLLRGVEDEVPISYGRFDLRDGSGLGLEAEEEDEVGSLLTGPGAIALAQLRIKSQARARTARVRMEAWDAEPPARLPYRDCRAQGDARSAGQVGPARVDRPV